ncbi:MAG: hypothetical protein ACK4UK_04005 [Flavobacterium sp.]
MRVFGFILAVSVSLFSTPKDFMLISNKQFTVQGSTSIGGFKCNYLVNSKDTLLIHQSNPKNSLSYTLPVREFGCGNFVLNNDFRKTLKAKDHPDIKIDFFNLRRNHDNLVCDVQIHLVGHQKMYKNLPLKQEKNLLKGDLIMMFSDFDLTPPKKLGGMVKVNEEIKLSIALQTH